MNDSDLVDGCGVERPDGARGRLSAGSGELCSQVAVFRLVCLDVSVFPTASNHPHSAALPPDVHRTRHQEG